MMHLGLATVPPDGDVQEEALRLDVTHQVRGDVVEGGLESPELSAREREVAALLADGKSSRHIGGQLHLFSYPNVDSVPVVRLVSLGLRKNKNVLFCLIAQATDKRCCFRRTTRHPLIGMN